MASIRKRNGKFQARIHRRGYGYRSKSFLTRADALKWARQGEMDLERRFFGEQTPTVSVLIRQYKREVTPRKKSARSEAYVLNAWERSPISKQQADFVTAAELAKWRDERITAGIRGSTIRNHLNTLSAVYRHAASEWGYQHLENPVARLKRPSPGKARSRRVSDDEIGRIKSATGSTYLAALIDLAIETGMRLSEIVSLQWNNLDLNARTAFLPDTKNGHPRTVPLSSRATLTLRDLRQGVVQRLDGALFPVTPHAVTVAFRRACKRVQKASGGSLAVNVRFHDLRHEAISRLFERGLNPMEVAAISGHRSMQMLARYTHISPTSLIAKIG